MAEVYAICFPNGKLYIGITTKTAEQRFQRHHTAVRKGSTCAVHNALRKYGPDSIRLVTLAHGVAWSRAKELEVYWIDRLRTMNRKSGYNMTAGGDGSLGCKPSKETRIRIAAGISAALKGRPKEGKALEAIRATARKSQPRAVAAAAKVNRGKPTSEQQKTAVSNVMRKIWSDPETRCQRLKQARTAIKKAIAVVGEAARKRWQDPEYRAKMATACAKSHETRRQRKRHGGKY